MSLRKFPFVFVADKTFALKPFMLRPFPRQMTSIFINLFSITDCLVQDRLLKRPSGYQPVDFEVLEDLLQAKLEIKKNITKAAGILHNFLMRQSTTNISCPPGYVDQETLQWLSPGSWHNEATRIQGLIHLRAQGSHNSTRAAKEVRNDSKDYFNSEYGKLSWQREIVQSNTSVFDEVD